MYPALDTVVAERDVAVIGNGEGATLSPPSHALRIRFNNDERPAEIWSTTFFSTRQPIVHDQARFIICPVPNKKIFYYNPVKAYGIDYRDWPNDIRRNDSSLPIEFMNPVHWQQLCYALPLFPLSGLAVLAMLQHTRVSSVEIHGFSFYISVDERGLFKDIAPNFVPHPPYFRMHDYISSILWLHKLILTDKRFKWRGEISIEYMLAYWKSQLRRRTVGFYFSRMPRRLARNALTNLKSKFELSGIGLFDG